jgi:uncharacterized protein (DUF1015 family)
MPDIRAFAALRYDPGHVGSLSNVIAPPYDVIDSDLQDELYKRHPANVIRLILGREEPGDDQTSNRYSRAARFLKNWQQEGVLSAEPDPALYIYHQQFDYSGERFTRRGFMARVRLERFGQGKIYPHEETMPGPKADRLKLTRACRANLSQIFGLYPDPDHAAQSILEQAAVGVTPLEATDHLGVVHRVWPITDAKVAAEVNAIVGPKPAFVADGHHRYETACNYLDELLAAGDLPEDHPARFVLMMCVSMSDPGMIVLPTHRLLRDAPQLASEDLIARLGGCFTCRLAGEGADLADTVWQTIATDGDPGQLGLFTQKDERWVVASITGAGKARLRQLASDHSEPWCDLGVSVLHRLLIDDLLDGANWPKPRYVHLVDEVVDGLDTGEFNLAALVMPATLDDVRVISENAERMPAKSTYFYPKLLSGLVINPLE